MKRGFTIFLSRFINSKKSDNSGCNVALFEGGITNGVSSIIEEFGR